MIMVVGATGIVSGMITRRLLEDGKDVRILVRTNSPSQQLAREGRATSAEELIGAGAQPAYGDLRNRASLDAAVQGVEAVITTANSAGREGEDNPRAWTSKATETSSKRRGMLVSSASFSSRPSGPTRRIPSPSCRPRAKARHRYARAG